MSNVETDPEFIIGITGKAGAGKSTVAAMLHSRLTQYNPHIISLAEPIKEMLHVALGVEKDKPVFIVDSSWRYMAQTLGTEWGRNLISEDIWLNVLKQKCKGRIVIVPDVRFENEAAFCREYGILLHIERIDYNNLLITKETEHASEQGIRVKTEDCIINNNGGMDVLHSKVEWAADYIQSSISKILTDKANKLSVDIMNTQAEETLEEEYSKMIQELVKDPAQIYGVMTEEKISIVHMAMGIAGEAGEILELVKKWFAYDRRIDKEEMVKELGDIEFYLEGMRQELRISRDDILSINIQKLRQRYGAKYSDSAAIARVDTLPQSALIVPWEQEE